MREKDGAGSGIPAHAAVGAVAVGAAAIVVGSVCLQLARTHAGRARVKVVRGARGERVCVLQQGGVYQSATYLGERCFEPVFEYIRAFDAMFEAEGAMRDQAGHGIERVLMLGGGGYSYPKHALTTHPDLSMDVVELDAAVTLLARRWFYLDELEDLAADRLRLVTSDARACMADAAAGAVCYDAVVNDCFAGAEPVRSLATVEALRQAKACLAPGGMYLANMVTSDGGEDIGFVRDAAASAAAVFGHVHVIPCTDEVFGVEDNYLLIATDGTYGFEGEMAVTRELFGTPLLDAEAR